MRDLDVRRADPCRSEFSLLVASTATFPRPTYVRGLKASSGTSLVEVGRACRVAGGASPVAPRDSPLIVLCGSRSPTVVDDRLAVGDAADGVGTSATFRVPPLRGTIGPDLFPVLVEAHGTVNTVSG